MRLWQIYLQEWKGARLLPMLTVKHVGGGSNFMRTTAAGGTGNTPPGTGCRPGAVQDRTANIKTQHNMYKDHHFSYALRT